MLRSLALAMCLATVAMPVLAESFLEKMARQAAEKVAQKATDAVMNGGSASSSVNSGDETHNDPQAGQVLKPKPRTGNAATPASGTPTAPAAPAPKAKLSSPGQIKVSKEIEAQKQAFDDFGRVSCNDCEGGRSYDSWAQRFFNGELAGEYNGWAKKLGKLNVGDRLTWKGQASKGSLTVVSETPVEGFRCKQLTYRLEKATSRAERPGLVCWGYLNQYSANENWVEVY